MSSKHTDMCTLTPVYPEIGFCTVVAFADDQMQCSAIFPLDLVHETPEAASEYAAGLIPKLEEDNPGYVAMEHVTVFPLVLDRLFELKPQYWAQPSIRYTHVERAQLFLKIAAIPHVHRLLVTPGQYRKGTWQHVAALPYLETMNENALEMFMMHSNWPVERRAKYSAIYRMRNPLHINWVTGKIAPNTFSDM